jgi:hypothetical protein
MNRRAWVVLTLATILIVVTACEGGTSGSVMGSRQRCSSKVDSGQCTGGFKKLSGTYVVEVENDRIFLDTPVRVEVQVSVESGSLKVWVESPGDEITSVDVAPGAPATLVGVAEGRGEGFDVYLKAVQDQAEGVSYEIIYYLE